MKKNITLNRGVCQCRKMILAVLLMCGFLLALPAVGLTAAYISPDAAKAIALKHAGFDEAEVKVVKLVRYDKRSNVIYDIDFLTSSARYSYEINALNGEILANYYKGIGKIHSQIIHNGAGTGTVTQPEANYIGTDRAKTIALEHAKTDAGNITKLEVKLKNKKGMVYYEVEFDYNQREYEYKIAAFDGEIIAWEYE